VETGKRAGSGIAVFSSSTGRFERWLVRGAEGLLPVTVGPRDRWVYYVSTTSGGWCAGNGYTQPVLWRVPSDGGRPRRTGLRTGSIAFTPDGRMAACVWTRHCGRTVWIVVRDRRAGTSCRIFLTRNATTSNNAVATAELSWSPDDQYLAVGISPAAAINSVTIVDTRHASAVVGQPIRPCAGRGAECLDSAFDSRGALVFLAWRQSGTAERMVRWNGHRGTTLFRPSADQSAGFAASIAVDRSGDAILLSGGMHRLEIWRWTAGRSHMIAQSTPRRTIVNPLWLE